MNEANSATSKINTGSESYKPQSLEKKWQETWTSSKLYETNESIEKNKAFYALSMFPYPSGSLHMGHVRNYVITDVIARFQRMQGFSVLHPMGWDAFGLPAENAAIERGVSPQNWTNKNIAQMKDQLKQLGLSVNWDKELNTSSSDYYQWTQSLFLELYDSDLAYQKSATVNWDPIDQTVLANEQVDGDGRSWRSGAKVEKRELKQWFLKITDYADKLLEDIKDLDGWPERVKTMQENWIGKSVGAEITFKHFLNKDIIIKVFTTRPDTINGVTYLALAPENKIVDQIIGQEKKEELTTFRERVSKINSTNRSSDTNLKNGMFLGTYVINPFNQEKIPLWIADYVLDTYGTGAVMGVPAHDQRDFQFAKENKLKIKQVISINKDSSTKELGEAYVSSGYIVNTEGYEGYDSKLFQKYIIEKGKTESWCCAKTSYRLRDWLISRQRYWGCPIPIVHCKKCGLVPVNKTDLPVKLPKDIEISGKGKSPLENNKSWSNTSCPKCGQLASRESDTMDTFMCSSWYFLRFADVNNKYKPFDKEKIDKWLPVNQYVGGIEHAILHLLYARFLTKALNDKGLINIKEPFKNLLTQGMVQGITYKNISNNKYVPNNKIKDINNPIDPTTGDKLSVIYEKMSKSKYNGVDPKLVIEKYGTDTARMFILFKAPPGKDLEWDDADVEGQYRFLVRLWRLINKYSGKQEVSVINKYQDYNNVNLTSSELSVRRSVHIAIKEITEDLKNGNQFNTAISELMKLSNKLNEELEYCRDGIISESLTILIKLLSPFAPHISEEFWSNLKGKYSVHQETWPRHDPIAILASSYEIVLQINGKFRGRIKLSKSLNEQEVKDICLSNEITKKWLNGAEPRRIILVKEKIINIVH